MYRRCRFLRPHCLAAVFLGLVLVCSVPANPQEGVTPESRVALVVGNSDYEFVGDLRNPKNDATDVAVALEKLGFDVKAIFEDMRKRQAGLGLRLVRRERTHKPGKTAAPDRDSAALHPGR